MLRGPFQLTNAATPAGGSLSFHLAEPAPVDAGCDSTARNHDEPEPQDQRDRVRSELDFNVNGRAESEILALSSRLSLSLVTEKLGDLEDLLRELA